jgi:hypothetical protein
MKDIYRNFKNSEAVEEKSNVPEQAESGGRGSESFNSEGQGQPAAPTASST